MELLSLCLVAAGGLALGGFHFVGLWYTLRHLPGRASPFPVMITSFLIRTIITMSGFYLLMQDDWKRLLIALVGFLGARLFVLRWSGPPGEPVRALVGSSRGDPS